MIGRDLLATPPPAHLPDDAEARELLDGHDAAYAARRHPEYLLAWALLAEQALDAGDDLAAYAYARTGYHRGLDQLRRAGWKGNGPIPWEHEPNRGFLRALSALARAAAALGEDDEAERCRTLLRGSSPAAADALGG